MVEGRRWKMGEGEERNATRDNGLQTRDRAGEKEGSGGREGEERGGGHFGYFLKYRRAQQKMWVQIEFLTSMRCQQNPTSYAEDFHFLQNEGHFLQ